MIKPKGCTYPDCTKCQLDDCEFDYEEPEIDTIGPLCPAEKREMYQRQYRRDHSDYFKRYSKQYYAAHKSDPEYMEKRRLSSKEWADNNKERRRLYSRERYLRRKNGEQTTS